MAAPSPSSLYLHEDLLFLREHVSEMIAQTKGLHDSFNRTTERMNVLVEAFKDCSDNDAKNDVDNQVMIPRSIEVVHASTLCALSNKLIGGRCDLIDVQNSLMDITREDVGIKQIVSNPKYDVYIHVDMKLAIRNTQLIFMKIIFTVCAHDGIVTIIRFSVLCRRLINRIWDPGGCDDDLEDKFDLKRDGCYVPRNNYIKDPGPDHNTTTRNTKPGLKRLFLTLTVLFSFILAAPLLMKSVEIYRSSLPFRDIDLLSNAVETNPLNFPCHFQVVFLGFGFEDLTGFSVDELGFAISDRMRVLSNKNQACGGCSDNFTVSVVLDDGKECVDNGIGETGCSWKCGGASVDSFGDDLEDVDERIGQVLGSCATVYSVVVVNTGEKVKAVVGKYRHAWIIGKVAEAEMMLSMVAEIFVKVFTNGGKDEGVIHGEFMPVGADGRIVLSFNLLNADPRDWIYDWDFQKVDEVLLAPIVDVLAPIANISIESQVLYHTPKSSHAYWDDKSNAHIFTTADLPFFVNSNEWHLDTSIAAGGRSKILQVAIYIPSAKECPLLLQLPSEEFSATNSFISPMWGGVIVMNPSSCLGTEGQHPVKRTISEQDLQKIFCIFLGQLRQLLGLKSENRFVGIDGIYHLLPSRNGFTEWELDVLSRQHACFNLLSCATTLGSLSRLVQSLPRMIIMDEIGKQVKLSLEAAKLAQSSASRGIYDASAISSRQARSLAEDAFFHPSIMSVSYYSFEHCFAVYSPFFLPVMLHVILAAIREGKRYKQENKKYLAWKKAKAE